ncbi:hypothetical protein [Paenibacillus sp. USHLN196]|uniref:hypothetical protein n=1 Tax=Paenibacillus sp. USHLN196 TaxID=3081291 RepID=UPI00301A6D7B
MVNQKTKELYALMDDLHDHKEKLDHYAIHRNRSGNRVSNRLKLMEEQAVEIEKIALKIQHQIQSMRRT